MSYIGSIIDGLRYTKEHEWAKIENGIATVGITDYAQHALTDIVFVELQQVGKEVKQFSQFCVVESVKSVSDIFAPLSGILVDVNTELANKPENINNEPYGVGWIAKIKISNKNEIKNLMESEEYKKYLEGLEH